MTEPMNAGTTLPVVPRLFTPDEADALVPRLETAFRGMDILLVRVREIQDLLEDEAAYWGGDVSRAPPPEQAGHASLAAELARTRAALDAEVSAVRDLGVEVKDVAMGLVDFYAHGDGDVVYLCWQRGEPWVSHWHTLEGGFQGRRPLERRHKGEP